ncbi:MAG: putative dehydrogenase [Planctomycetaceae bacterium]|jgi:predicted dehydrogenase
MIQVGLVGVGPQWERFRPALARLRQPIHVEAVYDPVFARAEKAAKDLDADPVTGISALAKRGNVEAILVMDPGWTRTAVLPLLARQEKPVFFASWPFSGQGNSKRQTAWHTDSNSLIVPAMWRRFFPGAIRLQELFATEIGQPCEIVIDLAGQTASAETEERRAATSAADSTLESLVGWLDFCRTLFRAFPISASVCPTSDLDGTTTATDRFFEFNVSYPPLAASKAASENPRDDVNRNRTAKLTLRSAGHDATITASSFVQDLMAGRRHSSLLTPALLATDVSQRWMPEVEMRCEYGSAKLNSTTELSWQPDSAESIRENLTVDRSEEEIMLDIFCRRVVGGLIPVADLNDIIRPIQLLRGCLDTKSAG